MKKPSKYLGASVYWSTTTGEANAASIENVETEGFRARMETSWELKNLRGEEIERWKTVSGLFGFPDDENDFSLAEQDRCASKRSGGKSCFQTRDDL